jgi:hypothetical protein
MLVVPWTRCYCDREHLSPVRAAALYMVVSATMSAVPVD